ncbi:H-type lectin domain-containing protein [Paracoccus sp. TOH]|uniref:H-type lectin domain-containing protein n=1 Tax=Paracoccus simplex TaxID=2086346 RepID=A0ABV7S5U9_9RHOB|nr:H-type lectin domain-containing protein [Paracoccus sp. TOH]WJS85944.1 H-type lectin domain-containing protein [Paracoccus sp. TOH]
MRRFGHFAVGVANGSTEMFSAFESGGPMWTGQGARVEVQRVRFDESFAEPPVVHVGLSMWDVDRNANQRADIQAAHITTDGFELQFRTWGDTRVARVRASWMAIGPVRHEDDWDPD